MIALPERGRIGIFNRSHYEECLVVRVHPEILAKQKIPPKLVTKDIWRDRFEDISAMERYVARNGTVILKFFPNVSRKEQRERFLERLEEPAKNWKFSMAESAQANKNGGGQVSGRLPGSDPPHLNQACAMAHRAGRPQMVRPRGHRLSHRQQRSTSSTCISPRSTRPSAASSSRCARRCWRKARAERRGLGRRSRSRCFPAYRRHFPRRRGIQCAAGSRPPTPASGISGLPPEPVIGRRIRSPLLTIFWHCGRAYFSSRITRKRRSGNEPSMVLAEDFDFPRVWPRVWQC